MRIHMSIPKRILALCLVFAAGIGMGSLSGHFISENSRFETFTEKLFQSEVTSSTLTLHYTLTHPEKKASRSLKLLSALLSQILTKQPVSVRNMKTN